MRDEIANGEALPDDGETAGVDVTGMLGLQLQSVLDPAARAALEEIENRAKRHYQRAWAENERCPTLHSAASLVRAYNAYADLMGIERA